MKRLLYGLLFLTMTQNVLLRGAELEPLDEALEILEDVLKNGKLHEIDNLDQFLNIFITSEKLRSFCSTALNAYLDSHRLHKIKDLSLLIDYAFFTQEQKQLFCNTALNVYLDAHKFHELKNLRTFINYGFSTQEQRQLFYDTALNFYFNPYGLHELKDLRTFINYGISTQEQKQLFYHTALNFYLDAHRLHELKNLHVLINSGFSTQEQKQLFCNTALNVYLDAQRLHKLNNLSILINNGFSTKKQKQLFCNTALNVYLDAKRLHEIKDLNTLINNGFSTEIEKKLFCNRALNVYLNAQRLHEIKDLNIFINNGFSTQEQKQLFCNRALNVYLNAKRLHEIKDLNTLISYIVSNKEQKQSFSNKVFVAYSDNQTLFKYDNLVKIFLPELPQWTFLLSTEKFMQKISTLDEELRKQLHMYYIKKAMQEKRDPAETLKFSQELIEPLSFDNIITMIEYMHESTDTCGESMGKVRPLCEAYLLQHCDDLGSMSMEYFTDLFMPFMTITTTPFFEKIIKKINTSKSIIIPKCTGEQPLKFKPNTPKKIQELYAQYNGELSYVGNELIIKRGDDSKGPAA